MVIGCGVARARARRATSTRRRRASRGGGDLRGRRAERRVVAGRHLHVEAGESREEQRGRAGGDAGADPADAGAAGEQGGVGCGGGHRGGGRGGREVADGEQQGGGDDHDPGGGQEPQPAGVGALAERVRDREHPHEDGPAVQPPPAGDADPRPRVVGEAERDQRPAADDPERGPQRLVVAEERDRHVGEARGSRSRRRRARRRGATIAAIVASESASWIERSSAPLPRIIRPPISRPRPTDALEASSATIPPRGWRSRRGARP